MAKVILGTETNYVRDLDETLDAAKHNKQDFVVIPLFHPRNRRDGPSGALREGPATRSDMVLESTEWISNVVGKITESIDLDNPCRRIQRDSEEIFTAEFKWACHLGLQAVVIPPPRLVSFNYARLVKHLCQKIVGQQQVWVRVPLTMPLNCRDQTSAPKGAPADGWYAWDAFRHLCAHDRRLFVALELTEDLPPPEELSVCQKRWVGEPVKTVIIPTRLFITNRGGFPVLSKEHQDLVKAFFRFKIHVVVKGMSFHDPSGVEQAADGSPDTRGGSHSLYLQYIRYLYGQAKGEASSQEGWHQAYNDYLQAPLQPLMDNLESQIYETFEKDPVKYERYEAAILKALQAVERARAAEIPQEGYMSIPMADGAEPVPPGVQPVVVTVVGAGRGPLVAAALGASCTANVPIRVYAVEKNPNAVITLRNRVKMESWTNVTVIATDMRQWRPPELAHIMVSELLGSWGDNELSPECLDGAQVCLRPDGVSIPCSYTSYISLVSAPKLWTFVQEMPDKKGSDIPYVVKFHNSYQVTEDKPLFYFSHPNNEKNIDNTRHENISFTADADATIHGFIGTFESVLFDDVLLSIMPKSFSTGMFSWFPLFIPLTIPMRVSKGDTITAHVWRCVDSKNVWYEWCVSTPEANGSNKVSAVQNVGGKNYFIGL